MKRLTDDKVADNLKENIKGLQAIGYEPDMSNLRYVRLAEYERFDEEVEGLGFRFTLDASKTIKELANEALDSYDYKGHTIREWVEIILWKESDK